MDLGTALIGLILTALCVIPIILIARGNKKSQNKLEQSLTSLAAKSNCKIAKKEYCGELIIGIDDNANHFFYVKQFKDKETTHHVNLAEMQQCKVINTGKTMSHKNQNVKVIDKLELFFTPTDKNKPGVSLEFYNADDEIQMTGELILIEKWAKELNQKLKSNSSK